MAEIEEVEYRPLLSAPESDGEEEEPPPVSLAVHNVPENGGKPFSPKQNSCGYIQAKAYLSPRSVEFLLNAIPPPGRWAVESCR